MSYSEYVTNAETLSSIADAVRNLTKKNQSFTPAQMISEMNEIIPDDYYLISPLKYKNSTLTSYLNNYAKIVGEFAFQSCHLLSQVSFPNCEILDAGAFQNCSVLTQVSFPKCEFIGEQAFESCYSLSQLTLIECKYINKYAFNYCSNLMSLYLNQASEMVTIATYAIFDSSPLSAGGSGTIYVPASLETTYKNDSMWSRIA